MAYKMIVPNQYGDVKVLELESSLHLYPQFKKRLETFKEYGFVYVEGNRLIVRCPCETHPDNIYALSKDSVKIDYSVKEAARIATTLLTDYLAYSPQTLGEYEALKEAVTEKALASLVLEKAI